MPTNPYRASLRNAKRMDRELERLFARYLGSAEHPRGAVLTAYRVAQASLRDIFRRGSFALESEVQDVLTTARMTLEGIARQALAEAEQMGRNSAQVQLAAYERAGVRIQPARGTANTAAMLTGWMTGVTAQLNNAGAMTAAGSDPGMIMAALAPAQIQREGSRLIAQTANETFEKWIAVPREAAFEPVTDEYPYQRQAIAAVDGRTTDCCLAVTGQIVDFDADFKLTADPRPWGNEIHSPPFHWNCRTSAVIYQEEFDDGVTEELRELAINEKARRADLREKIAEVQQELASYGARPDARKRKADDKYTKALRRELKQRKKQLVSVRAKAPRARPVRPVRMRMAESVQPIMNVSPETEADYPSLVKEEELVMGRDILGNNSAAIDKIEDEWAFSDREHGHVFDQDGRFITSKSGTESGIEYTASEAERMRNNVYTHNHPLNCSLSYDDVHTAVRYDMAEIRAVVVDEDRKVWRYIMQRPEDGWPSNWGDSFYQHNRSVYGQLQELVGAGQISEDQADLMHWHELWATVSQDAGIPYWRERVPERSYF